MNQLKNDHDHAHVGDTKGHTLDGLAPFYDWIVKFMSLGREKRFRKRTVELAEIQKGETVLEVGCGTGSLILAAKEQTGPDGRVAGTDPSARMIEIAEKKAQNSGMDVEFQLGVIEHIDFPDASFDVVLSSLMIHHLPGQDLKRAGIAECYRVLKPRGRLAILDMEPRQWSLVGLLHGQTAPSPNSPTRRLANLMEDSGFTDVKIQNPEIRGMGFVMGRK